jgi:hypothetical protein
MYVFKVLSEWSEFLTHITGGDWSGIDDLTFYPHTAGGTSYSFPVGTVNLEGRDWFTREIITHELSHQIMWQLADVSSAGVVGKVITGKLHMTHNQYALSTDQTALIEGWAEFFERLFAGAEWPLSDLFTDPSLKTRISLTAEPNLGEKFEAAFANALLGCFLNVICGEYLNQESADGHIFKPWMDDAEVRRKWNTAIWQVLKDMRSADSFTVRGFAKAMQARSGAEWGALLVELQKRNILVDAPAAPHWIEIVLNDPDGAPLAETSFTLRSPSGAELHGVTDASGFARIENVPEEGQWEVVVDPPATA